MLGYSLNASHMANGQELKDLAPRQLKPSVNLIHYTSRNSVTSQSIPSLLSADSMDDVASEPLYSGRNFTEDEPDSTSYLPVHDLSIARILGSFPELPYYQPPSATNSTENVRDAKVNAGRAAQNSTANKSMPIPRPRSNVSTATASRSKDFSFNSALYTDYESKASVESVNKSQSSAESLKVEIPGGQIRARDMSDIFEFTKLRVKKGKAVSTPNVSEITNKSEQQQSKLSPPTFETEV